MMDKQLEQWISEHAGPVGVNMDFMVPVQDLRRLFAGRVLVPTEPTDQMLGALWSTYSARPWKESATACYQSMLDAAPRLQEPLASPDS